MAAAAPVLGGCDGTEAAYAPWDGPLLTRDPRRRVAGWAVLAPSSHNLQPWKLHLTGTDSLHLYLDTTRLHPVTDPLLRQVTISQGTFLELLRLAAEAEGHHADIRLFPDGPYNTPDEAASRPVARVTLRRADDAVPPALFAAVRQRRTSRDPFSGKAVSAAARQAVVTAATGVAGVRVGFIDRGPQFERLRGLAIEGARVEMSHAAAMEELAAIMRLTKAEVLAHRDGLVPLPLPLGWMVRTLMGQDAFRSPDSVLAREGFKRMAEAVESTTAFLWIATPGNSRADQIAAGRAYMRLDLAAAAAGLDIQPLSQGLEEYPAMAAVRADLHRLLAKSGETVQMLVRLGHDGDSGHAPRRPVDWLLS